jgi:hypothetical protein
MPLVRNELGGKEISLLLDKLISDRWISPSSRRPRTEEMLLDERSILVRW